MNPEYEELCQLILHADVRSLCDNAPVLAEKIPELAPMVGFNQRSPHHAYDLFTHTAHVTAAVPEELTLRWAALLHDTGKITTFTTDETGRGHFYGHAGDSAAIAGRILRRLGAPTRLREDAVHLIELHMTRLEPDKKALRRWIARLGGAQLDRLLILQEADMSSKGVEKERDLAQFARLHRLLADIQEETP